jgi:hypothetical protein
MPMVAEPLRKIFQVRLTDDLMRGVDTQRGTEYRSTFVRKLVAAQAKRDVGKDIEDED